jgi:hypothetical protein
MFRMHADRRHLKTLSCPKGHRGVVTGNGDFATEHKRLSIEVMAMIGRDQVRLYAAVRYPIPITTELGFELKTIHWHSPKCDT